MAVNFYLSALVKLTKFEKTMAVVDFIKENGTITQRKEKQYHKKSMLINK